MPADGWQASELIVGLSVVRLQPVQLYTIRPSRKRFAAIPLGVCVGSFVC